MFLKYFFCAVKFASLNLLQRKIASLFDMLSDQKFAILNFRSLFLKFLCYLTILSLFWKQNTFLRINKTSRKHREAWMVFWGKYMLFWGEFAWKFCWEFVFLGVKAQFLYWFLHCSCSPLLPSNVTPKDKHCYTVCFMKNCI